MIVTIDGPAGSGKSTAARKLAARLEIAYLDTGAMYRAIAHEAMRRGVDFTDEKVLCDTARSIHLEIDCGPTHTRVRVDGHDVSEAIRTMKVSANTSFVARCQPIRDLLVEYQRKLGGEFQSFVSEGRDQGSVVFPHADAKFVLDAPLRERAERRCRELLADGQEVDIASVMENLRARDAVDARQWEGLLTSGQATVIDTTHCTIQQVIEHMVKVVRA